MDRESIFTTLKKAEPDLRIRGVQSLAIFGSVARGDYTNNSDLDILITFSRPVGLFEFIRIKQFLEEVTQCRVDLVTPDALREEMRTQILNEAIYVG